MNDGSALRTVAARIRAACGEPWAVWCGFSHAEVLTFSSLGCQMTGTLTRRPTAQRERLLIVSAGLAWWTQCRVVIGRVANGLAGKVEPQRDDAARFLNGPRHAS